jgi:hypothetical protein
MLKKEKNVSFKTNMDGPPATAEAFGSANLEDFGSLGHHQLMFPYIRQQTYCELIAEDAATAWEAGTGRNVVHETMIMKSLDQRLSDSHWQPFLQLAIVNLTVFFITIRANCTFFYNYTTLLSEQKLAKMLKIATMSI